MVKGRVVAVMIFFLSGCSGLGLPKMSLEIRDEQPKPAAREFPQGFQPPILVDAEIVGSLGPFDRILSSEQRELVAHAIHREPAGTYGSGNRTITIHAARPHENLARCRKFVLLQESPRVRLERIACHDGGNTWVVQESRVARR